MSHDKNVHDKKMHDKKSYDKKENENIIEGSISFRKTGRQAVCTGRMSGRRSQIHHP